MLSINVIDRLIPGRTAGYKAGKFDMLQQSFFFVFYAKKETKLMMVPDEKSLFESNIDAILSWKLLFYIRVMNK